MTDMTPSPEAAEAAARALYEFSTCDKVAKSWDDGSWRPEVKQTWYDGARLALEAARPHLRPPVEVGTSDLREALERTLGSLPVMTYDTVHHLDPGYRTQAMPKAQLLDLLALHPALDEAETKALCETATQVGLELGRREAAEEIAAGFERRAKEPKLRGTREGTTLLVCATAAREVATRTADARTDPSGHTDLPPTPDALSTVCPRRPHERHADRG